MLATHVSKTGTVSFQLKYRTLARKAKTYILGKYRGCPQPRRATTSRRHHYELDTKGSTQRARKKSAGKLLRRKQQRRCVHISNSGLSPCTSARSRAKMRACVCCTPRLGSDERWTRRLLIYATTSSKSGSWAATRQAETARRSSDNVLSSNRS